MGFLSRLPTSGIVAVALCGCTKVYPPSGQNCLVTSTGGATSTSSGSSSGTSSGGSTFGTGGNGFGTGTGGGDAGGTAGDGSTGGSGGSGTGPMGEWKNETSNLAGKASECGNLSVLSVKPDEDMLIASVAQQGLWSSTDGGTTWNALGTGAMSDKVTNRGSALVYDPDHPQTFYESGTYNGGGVYQTIDDGATLLQLGDTTQCDLVSADFTDPDRKTLLAGGHEQGHALFRSIDSGMTWASIGANLPDNTNCTFPLIIDGMTYLVGCGGYGGGIAGIGRSTDGGTTWTQVSSSGGSRVPLVASDGSIYWSSAVNGGLARSTDKGVTWSQTVGTGVLMTDPPIELPDGRIAAVGSSAIVVSTDHGVTWTAVTSEIPYIKSVGYNDAGGVLYSVPEKAFYIYHSDCGNSVPSDAVLRYDFDYTTE